MKFLKLIYEDGTTEKIICKNDNEEEMFIDNGIIDNKNIDDVEYIDDEVFNDLFNIFYSCFVNKNKSFSKNKYKKEIGNFLKDFNVVGSK
jgi:hypothetical protein